jgi:hypothetical protein
MDKLSNIIKAFNDQFGGLFNDSKAVEKRIATMIAPWPCLVTPYEERASTVGQTHQDLTILKALASSGASADRSAISGRLLRQGIALS